jgi:hypothetical protein
VFSLDRNGCSECVGARIPRHTVEFALGPFDDIEVLAHGKPREAEAKASPAKAKGRKSAAAANSEAAI